VTVDQSAAKVATIQAYGGSDSTLPNFNRPSYVRFFSVHQPRDFGAVPFLRLDLEGLVGAESGTQTLFFSFTTTKPARIGLRRINTNRYTDQYISIGLRDPDGKQVPLGADGFARSSVIDIVSIELLDPLEADIGYAVCGYWDKGYAEYDCFKVFRPSRIQTGDPDDPFESLGGELMPPGRYVFTVSSSQWPQLPYRIQAIVAPQVDLAGAAEFRLEPQGRLAIQLLRGSADLSLAVTGRIAQTFDLGGVAGLALDVRANLNRQSPFD
jgi:hypothetical protein